MEGVRERRHATLRSRKPLGDITNTTTTAINPRHRNNDVPFKAPKPTTTNINRRPQVQSLSSAKSDTASTGSNDASPPAPPTPLSDLGGRDRRKVVLPVAQTQRTTAKIWSDKGRVVSDNTVIQASKPVATHGQQMAVSAAQNQRKDEKRRKGKGQMVLETHTVQASEALTPHVLQSSSSAATGNCHVSHPASLSLKSNFQTMKDKGKMVLKIQNTVESGPAMPRIPLTSSSPADSCHITGPSLPQTQKPVAQSTKDKGKMALDEPNIEETEPLTPALLASSSASSGNCHHTSQSAGSCKQSDGQMRKDEGKVISEALLDDATDPLTPDTLLASSSSTPGTHVQEEMFLTVYQRKAPRRSKATPGNAVAFSCPSKRKKKTGEELVDGSLKKSGSHTDPLPLHKKRSRSKNVDGGNGVHCMPQNEVERLRAYFADIDAFELEEEVATELD